MAGNKTVKTTAAPLAFLRAVEDEQKREDCLKIFQMMKDVTGWSPKMWGPSIIGFGDYHYKYESGREGDFFRVGLSPRARYISVYIMPGYQDFDDELSRLGKHKKGKACLNITRLSDVDEDVLRELIVKGLALMEKMYPL